MKTPDRRALRRIELKNLLSFGPDSPALELENLNILIGPNGSGKSNLIEAISLLRATPISAAASNSDLRGIVLRGGGVDEWIWKGGPINAGCIDILVAQPKQTLRHHFSFRSEHQAFRVQDERIENEKPTPGEHDTYFYYRFQPGRQPVINTNEHKHRKLAKDTVNAESSILSQRRDPELYPEIAHLAEVYERIRIYREWTFGRNTIFREPQRADMRSDRLEENFSNLGLFLSRLNKKPRAKKTIAEALRDLYEGFTDFDVVIEGGSVQIFFTEREFSIPATRLSDGTLRYLCLLAVLCDPDPPALICLEEPELGLHPDIIPKLADLLMRASERTQLIVTTHSDVLVDAMTNHPEAVVICEKVNGQTHMKRLSGAELKPWLQDYRLGQLWSSGEIGGNRW